MIRQQKEREEQKQQFDEARAKLESRAPALRRFDASSSEALEMAFKSQTVGLVTREEFQEKRKNIAESLIEERKRFRESAEEKGRLQKDVERAKRARAE